MANDVLRCSPLAQPDTLLIVEEATTTVGQDACVSSVTASTTTSTPASGRVSPLDVLDAESDSWLRTYRRGETLGRGAYGEVFKAMVGGRFLAVKRITIELSDNPAQVEKEVGTLLLEINTLKKLKHPRIVRYHGCFYQDAANDPAVLIFLDWMPGGSIKGVLDMCGPYGSGLVRKYTRQILEGLGYLHSERIVHRDVKGANILIDLPGDAALADFGACRELEALHLSLGSSGQRSIHGSIYWMAPEVSKCQVGRRSDIWSLGCTVIEMMTAEPPWPNLRIERMSVAETIRRIIDGDETPPLPPKISAEARHFLECILIRDHTKRPYAAQLLKHRFVRQESSVADSESRVAAAVPAWGTK